MIASPKLQMQLMRALHLKPQRPNLASFIARKAYYVPRLGRSLALCICICMMMLCAHGVIS